LPCKLHETFSAGRGDPEEGTQLDGAGLRRNFADVVAHGDDVPKYFYSDLFVKHPEARDMFPVSAQAQRGHFVHALAKIVSNVDSPSDLTMFLEALGRDHRRFGAGAEHYDAVGASLLATLEHFSGPSWTPELRSGWRAAYEHVGSVMAGAAEADELQRPPCMAEEHVHIEYFGWSES
jgi:hemoglobin-like flavoprotein